jgi:hypothetical protein
VLEVEERDDTDIERLAWRRRRLRALGVDGRLASLYADDVDYHDVEALMERTGWTAEQAFELLRP